MTETSILLQRDGAIARLTLNRPDRLNSLTLGMLGELSAALTDLDGDESVRAVVLTGMGRAFCAGQDLADHEAMDDTRAVRSVVERHYNPVIRQIRALPQPVIAAVNGVAAGAGCSLALACDIAVASASAKFINAFVNIGLIPDCGGSYFLPRLIGQARALGMTLLGEPLDATVAADWGLIWKAVPDSDFAGAVDALARRLAEMPTAAIGLIKHAINVSGHHSLEQQLAVEAELQAAAAETEDYQEGRAAFLEKRKPRFFGR
ncbi:MAG TPA: enoyl-CoA hydratase-related protein [Dongiaceae bacterium]|jgi:2-(1,2-epoxy-1,2-dihydrophenyl)acetyl-CoA isomerase|nr:enoyl-CoA hydratase-related protein [Dongiaceae bacterium]